jgi:hypothetical protein
MKILRGLFGSVQVGEKTFGGITQQKSIIEFAKTHNIDFETNSFNELINAICKAINRLERKYG